MSKAFDNNGTILKYIFSKIKSALDTVNSAAVHKTGDETISGKKTFTYVKAGTIDLKSVDSSDEWAQLNLNDDGGGDGYISVDSSLRDVRLNGIADPTENNDAATKSYVDGKDASAAHKAGSETFTGRKSFTAGASFSDVQVGEDGLKILTAGADEINVTPSWDDDNGINILNLVGDSGDVLIKGVHAPSANTDAANKAYVDNHHDSTKANDNQVVKTVAQTLTSADQGQVQRNIGVYSKAEVDSAISTAITTAILSTLNTAV